MCKDEQQIKVGQLTGCPMQLKIKDGIVQLTKLVIETALNCEKEDLKGKVLVMKSKFTEGRGRDSGMVPATWLPKELQGFCESPNEIVIPKTIKRIAFVRRLDVQKIEDGNPKGQCLIGFKSEVEQALGESRSRLYTIGYELVSKDEIQVGGLIIKDKFDIVMGEIE